MINPWEEGDPRPQTSPRIPQEGKEDVLNQTGKNKRHLNGRNNKKGQEKKNRGRKGSVQDSFKDLKMDRMKEEIPNDEKPPIKVEKEPLEDIKVEVEEVSCNVAGIKEESPETCPGSLRSDISKDLPPVMSGVSKDIKREKSPSNSSKLPAWAEDSSEFVCTHSDPVKGTCGLALGDELSLKIHLRLFHSNDTNGREDHDYWYRMASKFFEDNFADSSPSPYGTDPDIPQSEDTKPWFPKSGKPLSSRRGLIRSKLFGDVLGEGGQNKVKGIKVEPNGDIQRTGRRKTNRRNRPVTKLGKDHYEFQGYRWIKREVPSCYECETCGKLLKSRDSALAHVKRVHLGEKTRKRIVRDCRKNKPNKNPPCPPEGRSYACSHEGCGEKFVKNYQLKLHSMSNHRQQSYGCKHCPKKFFGVQDLHQHFRMKHKRKHLHCNLCDDMVLVPNQNKDDPKRSTSTCMDLTPD